jgi:acyl-CoA dehydrogenase
LPPTGGLIALAFAEDASATPAADAAQWGSPPVFHDVPWGGLTPHFLIVSKTGTGAQLILTKTPNWTITPGSDAAGEPRDRLAGENVPIMTALSASSYDDILRAAAILRGGQILGAIEWAFRRSVEYATERKQFGREIGKFQVVQQMLAELADHGLASAGLTEAAVEAFSPTLVAAARSRLADAADATIEISHQVHGAIGFSREYALNYRTRRLMAWRDDFGSVLFWRRMLANSFLGLSREAFWPAVADAGLRKLKSS